jgi:hypothetical protein
MTNKERRFRSLIESTTEILNDNMQKSIVSADMLKDILILFSDSDSDSQKELSKVSKTLYNKTIQNVASKLLELCFLDENIENLN